MNRWQWYTRKIRRFGERISPAIENLSLDSLKHFKQEPALWIGAIGAVVTAVNTARVDGADGWSIAAVVVIAVGGFIARANVSPANVADSE